MHRAASWTIRRSSIARSVAIWLDDALRYGQPNHSKKWWWDFEDEAGDGILKIPADRKNDFLINE
jgi:hypothetical protein